MKAVQGWMIIGPNQGGQLFRTLFRYIWPQTILYSLLKLLHFGIVERNTSCQNLITCHSQAVDVNFEGILQ
jgi:hypothetical protein